MKKLHYLLHTDFLERAGMNEFEEIRCREIGAKKGYEEFTDQTVWMGIKQVIDNINANAVA